MLSHPPPKQLTQRVPPRQCSILQALHIYPHYLHTSVLHVFCLLETSSKRLSTRKIGGKETKTPRECCCPCSHSPLKASSVCAPQCFATQIALSSQFAVVTFVRLFSTVCFQMYPQIALHTDCTTLIVVCGVLSFSSSLHCALCATRPCD